MRPPSAEFVTSVIADGRLPAINLPIIAMVGRSNVGKSSLINALVKHRIARSGAKPGTTRLLNLYRISTARPKGLTFLIADLPGYGYASGGTQTHREFDQLTGGFFTQLDRQESDSGNTSQRLAGVVLVVDIRHPELQSDLSARAWISHRGYPLVAVATKADRIARSRQEAARRRHSDALQCPVVLLSTRTGEGIGKVFAKILGVL